MNSLLKTAVFLLLCSQVCFSQLANHNMYLLANIDERRVPPKFSAPWHYSGLWGYAAPNGREYAILGCTIGTAFVDITDSANIHEVAFFPAEINVMNPDPGNLWREVKVYSHYAYVVSEADSSGIEIFDLQYLPDSVRRVGRAMLPGHRSTHTISQSGPYLYLNGGNSGFGQGVTVVDLMTNPEQPLRRGFWNTLYVHDSRIVNDTIWGANIYNGRLTVLDARNKDSVWQVSSWQTFPPGSFTHNVDLTNDRQFVFVTHETQTPPGRLSIWNVQDVTQPQFIREWQPTGIANTIVHNVEIYDSLAVIAHYEAGVRVLDISDPSNPIEIAWYDTRPSSNTNEFDGCWAVYMFPSGKIIASDMQTGLYVLKIGGPVHVHDRRTDIDGFTLLQNYPNPFNSATTVRYRLHHQASVKLRVYNVLGEEIATLVQTTQPAGWHEVQWDATQFPSGMYFYRLEAGAFNETRKLILLR